ncbi:hypothetical protein K490DRAFT_53898 [Saccharata proteae CBS 121410]|uniref:Aminoglycoside phosphotransferase domain-containing protein n=1 Tax=Saccharata proteae CBS 121410 TaxID=1314787 RepID=A0A9P4M184_9PEZI|nr:hypothetical protein K490DRAFT_53898 [Saccharata proteae CBS 121410]
MDHDSGTAALPSKERIALESEKATGKLDTSAKEHKGSDKTNGMAEYTGGHRKKTVANWLKEAADKFRWEANGANAHNDTAENGKRRSNVNLAIDDKQAHDNDERPISNTTTERNPCTASTSMPQPIRQVRSRRATQELFARLKLVCSKTTDFVGQVRQAVLSCCGLGEDDKFAIGSKSASPASQGKELGQQPPQASSSSSTVSPEDYMARWLSKTFGSIASIPDNALLKLASTFTSTADTAGEPSSTGKVDRDDSGTNNFAFMVQINDENPKICIRVPACGREGLWTNRDAQALREYALIMKMIGENTKFPIPKVLGFDNTMDNFIGAPYIAMSFAEGRPVEQIWHEDGEEQESKRQRILKTLAEGAAELRSFKFTKMGAVKFHEDDKTPYIGTSYNANFGFTVRDAEFFEKQEELYLAEPHTSSRKHAEERLNVFKETNRKMHGWKTRKNGCFWEGLAIHAYMSAMLDIIEANLKKSSVTAEETFVLCHADYDWQNIFADDNGTITAVIDWDRLETVPQFRGWSRVPDFLQHDWEDNFTWPYLDLPRMSPEDYDRYRADYARYMKDACGEEESKFTAKSALYDCTWSYAGFERDQEELVRKVVHTILPRIPWSRGHLLGIGKMIDEGRDPIVELGLKARLDELFSV